MKTEKLELKTNHDAQDFTGLELPEFRIWHKEEKQMIMPLLWSDQGTTGHIDFYEFGYWEYVNDVLDISDKDSVVVPEKKVVVCHSNNAVMLRDTGCFDSKYQPVYEGDIVKIENGLTFVVVYKNGLFNLSEAQKKIDEESGVQKFSNLTVLGNVFANPDLLPPIF